MRIQWNNYNGSRQSLEQSIWSITINDNSRNMRCKEPYSFMQRFCRQVESTELSGAVNWEIHVFFPYPIHSKLDTVYYMPNNPSRWVWWAVKLVNQDHIHPTLSSHFSSPFCNTAAKCFCNFCLDTYNELEIPPETSLSIYNSFKNWFLLPKQNLSTV